MNTSELITISLSDEQRRSIVDCKADFALFSQLIASPEAKQFRKAAGYTEYDIPYISREYLPLLYKYRASLGKPFISHQDIRQGREPNSVIIYAEVPEASMQLAVSKKTAAFFAEEYNARIITKRDLIRDTNIIERKEQSVYIHCSFNHKSKSATQNTEETWCFIDEFASDSRCSNININYGQQEISINKYLPAI